MSIEVDDVLDTGMKEESHTKLKSHAKMPVVGRDVTEYTIFYRTRVLYD